MTGTKKVAVADVLTEELARRWRDDLGSLPIDLRLIQEDTASAFREALEGADILITKARPVDNDLLEIVGDQLKLIAKLSHWPTEIDRTACEEKGIQIELLPQLGCIAVAEHAMALILACARMLIPSHQGVITGAYRELGLTPAVTTERTFAFKWLSVDPFEVYGKTLGIIGLGEIGKEVAVRARSFGMKILYNKRTRLPQELEKALGVEFCNLNELLKSSDFVSLHIPHTQETDKLLGRSELQAMKPTAYLINTARGGLIDEEALVCTLRDGEIAGAGLDVFVEEPLPYDNPLLQLGNVVLTPHIGGGSGAGRAVLAKELGSLISRIL